MRRLADHLCSRHACVWGMVVAWFSATTAVSSFGADDVLSVESVAAFQRVQTFESPVDFDKLPAALPVYRYLKALGLSPVPQGNSADVRLDVARTNSALGAQYSNGYFLAGADVTVVLELHWGEHRLNRVYRGTIKPPEKIVVVDKQPIEPPYELALEAAGFPRKALDVLGELRRVPPDVHQAAAVVATGNWTECSRMRASVIGPLLAVLDDRQAEYRMSVAKALGQRKDPRIVPALTAAATREAQPDALLAMCRALLASDEASGGQALLKMVENSPLDRQKAIVEVLTESTNSANLFAVVRFVSRVNGPHAYDRRVDVIEALRGNAVENDAAAAPMVALALDTFREANWQRFSLDQQTASVRRSNLNFETVNACRAPLREAANSGETDVRTLALAWLGELKDEPTRKTAAKLLNDAAPEVRRAAVQFFANIDYGAGLDQAFPGNGASAEDDAAPESAVQVLPAALTDPDRLVRTEALTALMSQGWEPRDGKEHRAADSVWRELPAEQTAAYGEHPWGPPPWDPKQLFLVLLVVAAGAGLTYAAARSWGRK